jgi:hypothetical protein
MRYGRSNSCSGIVSSGAGALYYSRLSNRDIRLEIEISISQKRAFRESETVCPMIFAMVVKYMLIIEVHIPDDRHFACRGMFKIVHRPACLRERIFEST